MHKQEKYNVSVIRRKHSFRGLLLHPQIPPFPMFLSDTRMSKISISSSWFSHISLATGTLEARIGPPNSSVTRSTARKVVTLFPDNGTEVTTVRVSYTRKWRRNLEVNRQENLEFLRLVEGSIICLDSRQRECIEHPDQKTIVLLRTFEICMFHFDETPSPSSPWKCHVIISPSWPIEVIEIRLTKLRITPPSVKRKTPLHRGKLDYRHGWNGTIYEPEVENTWVKTWAVWGQTKRGLGNYRRDIPCLKINAVKVCAWNTSAFKEVKARKTMSPAAVNSNTQTRIDRRVASLMNVTCERVNSEIELRHTAKMLPFRHVTERENLKPTFVNLKSHGI